MRCTQSFSMKCVLAVICWASAHVAVANIVPDLRDTDVALVVEKGVSPSVRWFTVGKCTPFKSATVLKKLQPGVLGKPEVGEPDDGAFLSSVKECAAAKDDASIRIIGTPTAVWLFTVAADGIGPEKAEIQETQRKTRLETDLQTLLKILLKEVKVAAPPKANVAVWVKPLQFTRANVLATVTWTSSQTTTVNLVTGPNEHLYLSADLPIDNVSMVKYDENGNVTTTSAPSKFYGGLNYSFGDIGLEKASWSLSSLSVKVLMQISSKPLDGFGAGLGFRLPAIQVWGFKLNTLSVFGAVIWLREDASASSTHYKAKLRGGLSLNLDAALGWIKG